MRRLQMGMWHLFSEDQWNQYKSDKITGLEISQYQDISELEKASLFCNNNSLKFGIHTPVFGNDKTLPEVTSLDKEVYQKAILSVEEQVKVSADYGADYLLLHYPFPPIYSTLVDRCYWDGAPDHAYYYSENYGEDHFKYISERLFEDLSVLQDKYQQKIVLEYDFFAEYKDVFSRMFEKYPQLQLVIDTQRMEHNKRTFPGFDPYKWLDQIYQYVYLVHYSNVRFGEKHQRHLPVLPFHETDTNYGDSLSYLSYLSKKNDLFHVTFEHNPSVVSPEELEVCYETVQELLTKRKQAK
ncbi:sugar phosphate isomerase/epimerase [Neobacillus sp. D3-1R]|uniref:sugar phosphate isomerase/epimerase n=1 Tax=Neobacillus sp. D3-1R TaxID=3445778 RepID=UPI003F9F2097